MADNPCVAAVAGQLGRTRLTVRHGRDRGREAMDDRQQAEKDQDRPRLRTLREQVLDDAPRPGTPAPFRPEPIVPIVAVACEPPKQSDRPLDHGTGRA